MKQFCLLLVCIVLLSFATAQVKEKGIVESASRSNFIKNTFAIVVGISKYQNIDTLQYADRDAIAFANFLSTKTGGSVAPSNLYLLLNEKATTFHVAEALSDIRNKADSGDRVFFYFSGHGDMEDFSQTDNALLLVYDSPDGNYFGMNSSVLQVRDLKNYFTSLTATNINVVLIVDACHSGNLKGGVAGLQRTTAALYSEWTNEYKILSCQPNQVSVESYKWGGGRGLFSLHLENGMKGLADKNKDGSISYLELWLYIAEHVNISSDGRQIPLLTGDLSKRFLVVDRTELQKLIGSSKQNAPKVTRSNLTSKLLRNEDSLSSISKAVYNSFTKNLSDKNLVLPLSGNAYNNLNSFVSLSPDHTLIPEMRVNLARALMERFDAIVSPIMKGHQSVSSRKKCDTAARELDSCLKLLGNRHYLYDNVKARKLYMEAMALTWALDEYEFNEGIIPTVHRAILLLEESEKLQPNAPYTISALGSRYFYVSEFEKAFEKFQKYLNLRPNDLYSRYSYGRLLSKLKQYRQAAELFEKLTAELPGEFEFHYELFDAYFKSGNFHAALSQTDSILRHFDTANAYLMKGQYYSQRNNLDSSVFYYRLAKKALNDTCNTCDNNMGYDYTMNRQLDKAKYYFDQMIKIDENDPFANFNLGMIEALKGNFRAAIKKFDQSLNINIRGDGFQTHFEVFYNKRYRDTLSENFKNFSNSVFNFSLQYACYSYRAYCMLRDPTLRDNVEMVETAFQELNYFKEYEIFNRYHYACYKSLKKESLAALKSLEEALKGGFGYYFMLANDSDLDYIRNEPDFKALLRKYFPNEKN